MRFSATAVYVLACLIFMAVPPAAAREGQSAPALEETGLFLEIPSVYSASKYEQSVREAPASVSIVTAEEIAQYGYRTLADILRSQHGFYVSYDRNYDFLGVRGFSRPSDYNTRLLLLVDGVRLNDSVYDTASIGREFVLDVDLIDRVEIIRGPGSSLYGSNALLGVINVLTKKGRDLKGFQASGEAGSLETYKARITYGNRFAGGLETLFSGTWYRSEGDDRLYFPEYDDDSTNGGVFEDGDRDEAVNLFGKMSLGDFTVEGAYVEREKRIPTGAYGTEFNDNRTFAVDAEYFLDLRYEHLYENKWNIHARTYYAAYPYDGDFVYDYAEEEDEEPLVVINRDSTDARWWGAESHLSGPLSEKHYFTAGVEYRGNIRQDQKNFDLEVYLDDRRDSNYWSMFLQDEWRPVDSLIVNAGIRLDVFESFDDVATPRFALIYNPVPTTTFKLLYGKAFRNPNAYEVYYHDGGETQKASTDLGRESIATYELVVEQQIGPHVRASAAGFLFYMDDIISLELDPDDLLVFRNAEDVEARGVELELEAQLPHGLGGRLSYTYQDAENRQTGAWLTNSPRHLATLNVRAPLLKDLLSGGLEVTYRSGSRTKSDAETDGYFLANLTLSSDLFADRVTLSATLYNLFDEKYALPASEEFLQDTLPQDGRTFRAKLTYNF